MPPKNHDSARCSKWLLAAPGLLPAALGLIVLIGWYAHAIVLIQPRSTLAPMSYNAALCLLLSGVALTAVCWRRGRFSEALAGIVIAFGALTLCEYLFKTDLGIDQFLFRCYIITPAGHAGRMSPVTALCFLNVGFSLLFLSARSPSLWRPLLAGSLGASAFVICSLAILGYAIGLPGAYTWGQLASIAPHTASGLGLLGAGVFLAAWRLSPETGGRTPRWLPIAVGLSGFAASLVLWQALETKQKQQGAQSINAAAESVRNQLSVRLDARLRSIERMAKNWEFSGRPTQAAWEAAAKDLVKDNPEIRAVEWIDAANEIQWITPQKSSVAKQHLDLMQGERRRDAAEKAQKERPPAITRSVQLPGGGAGFAAFVPIYIGADFDGFIAEVLEAQPLFDRYLPPAVVAVGSTIRLSDGAKTIYERNPSPPPPNKEWIVTSKIDLHGVSLRIKVWPTPELRAQLDSRLPEVELGAGLLSSLLLAMTTFLAQTAAARARESANTNRELQTALAEVKTLSGLLPICSYCKRIRDDTGYWNRIESYLARHSDASFSHGACPECAVKAFEDAGMDVPAEVRAAQAAHKYD